MAKINEIVLDVARISLVEFEGGQNTLAVLIDHKINGGLTDATHWAGVLCPKTRKLSLKPS
jgi:hypothetical protein